jgi:elongation factor Ts
MAEITAALVKELRETSGAGMMDCKKALQETNGDIEAAVDWLRAKGLSKAAKKAGRAASDGLVAVNTAQKGAGMIGTVVELNAETDFVARNDGFQSAVREIASIALKGDGTLEGLKASPMGDSTVEGQVTDLVAKIGENMTLRRVAMLSVDSGVVAAYVHSAIADGLGKIGVLVALESAGKQDVLNEVGRKVAMHVAATSPMAARADELDPAVVERERAILTEQAKESGKPMAVIEKMIEGRIRKFYEEVVLEKQAFVMNPDQTVAGFIEASAVEAGAPIALKGFVRFTLGEGVEKEEGDFAAEVAQMTGKA